MTAGGLAGRAVGVLVLGAAVVSGLVACAASSEGTVIAKTGDTYDYGCQQGGTMTGPVAVPAWGSCAEPRCRRLVVRDSAGTTYEPCVSSQEYDRTQVGEFWHGRTDR